MPVEIPVSVLGRLLRFPTPEAKWDLSGAPYYAPRDALHHRPEWPRVGLVLPMHQQV